MPAVNTTWKIWKKIVKRNFGMENKIGRFFGPPYIYYFKGCMIIFLLRVCVCVLLQNIHIIIA